MRALSPQLPPGAARRLAGAAVCSVAVVGLTATTASAAADVGNVEVAPSPVHPGGTAVLSTDACGEGGSAGVDASSLGAGILGLEPKDAKAKTAEGELRIPADTKPGNYAVGGSCTDGQELTGTVVVSDKQPAKGKEHQDRHAPEPRAGERDASGQKGAEPHHEKDPGHREDDRHHGKEDDRHHGKGDHHAAEEWRKGQLEWAERHHRPDRHDDRAHHDKHGKHDRHGEHGKMPHGRVHTGLGGGSEDLAAGRLAGGSLALAAAAGGVLYLRRRHRRLGA